MCLEADACGKCVDGPSWPPAVHVGSLLAESKQLLFGLSQTVMRASPKERTKLYKENKISRGLGMLLRTTIHIKPERVDAWHNPDPADLAAL